MILAFQILGNCEAPEKIVVLSGFTINKCSKQTTIVRLFVRSRHNLNMSTRTRLQIIKEGYKDPGAELQRRLAERERFNNPAAFVQRHYEEVTLDADVVPAEPTNGQYAAVSGGNHYVKEENAQRIERSPPVVMLDDDDNARQNDNDDDDHDDGGGHYDAAPSPSYSQNSNSNSGYR